MANRFGKSVLPVANPRVEEEVRSPSAAAGPKGKPSGPLTFGKSSLFTVGPSGWPVKSGKDRGKAASGKSWNDGVSHMPDERGPKSPCPSFSPYAGRGKGGEKSKSTHISMASSSTCRSAQEDKTSTAERGSNTGASKRKDAPPVYNLTRGSKNMAMQGAVDDHVLKEAMDIYIYEGLEVGRRHQ